jgi:hypothetical protein
MMAMMLIRSGNISILAQAAIIASPTTIANPNMLLYQRMQIGTESKADIRRWDNDGARNTEKYEDIVREKRV